MWETHKPCQSGCPIEMTPVEAHQCEDLVQSDKADGNRGAKSPGIRKSRARGDHSCHTTNVIVGRNNVSGISLPLRGAEHSNANVLLLPTARTFV